MNIMSTSFRHGGTIPEKFSAYGDNISPSIRIEGLTPGAKSWALIMDDPDAPRGTWTHWTFWDLPVARGNLPAGADVKALGAVEGTTSAKSAGYHGPCPPGGTHRYVVHAFATNGTLGLQAGASVDQVWKAVQAKAVAEGTLMGRFSR
jgi:Raf kinase inhibitor-like YbhB/YbcL family protein